jgi:ATP-binding cassette, subfamily F, member 3
LSPISAGFHFWQDICPAASLALSTSFLSNTRFIVITLQGLSYEIGGRFLYQQVDWQISPGQKIGLIGKNGTGKSTLLRIITGQYKPTEGSVQVGKSVKIGFLNQDLLSFESDEPIIQVAMSAFARQIQLQTEIDELLERLEKDATYDEQLLNDLSDKQMEFDSLGGYTMESRAYEVLDGLGFSTADCQRSFNTFSGGWRMRVMLAKILLEEPDLLLLDEPTNHLDLPSIQWMEGYIQQFKGSYLVVSHDRYFLDQVVTTIVEISHSKLHFYTGNYSSFLVQKEERRVIHQSAFENQQKYIEESQRFIDRFRAKATKASQAQSRIKQLEKLDIIEAPDSDESSMSLTFRVAKRPGGEIVNLRGMSKAFGEKVILKEAEGAIRRGDKIGLIGANGMGKTTVLRIIAQDESYTGDVNWGYQVETAYFAQHQLESLKLSNSVWDEVYYSAPNKTDSQVRAVLGSFLFSGDDVHKKIQVLSGGERSRVALAKTLLQEANFMLLDEPTNHLDMQSINILTDALNRYEGSFVVVSHDRHFLRGITNKIWYIEDLHINEYPGTYAEYEVWRQQLSKRKAATNGQESKKQPDAIAVVTSAAQPKAKEAKTLSNDDRKELKRLQNQFKKLEETIEQLESQKQGEESKLAELNTRPSDYQKIQQLMTAVDKITKELERTTAEWEECFMAIETLNGSE